MGQEMNLPTSNLPSPGHTLPSLSRDNNLPSYYIFFFEGRLIDISDMDEETSGAQAPLTLSVPMR